MAKKTGTKKAQKLMEQVAAAEKQVAALGDDFNQRAKEFKELLEDKGYKPGTTSYTKLFLVFAEKAKGAGNGFISLLLDNEGILEDAIRDASTARHISGTWMSM